LINGNRLGTRAGRLAADIKDIGALLFKQASALNRQLRTRRLAAIRKTVRSNIDDPQNQGPSKVQTGKSGKRQLPGCGSTLPIPPFGLLLFTGPLEGTDEAFPLSVELSSSSGRTIFSPLVNANTSAPLKVS
jgi:hypothetical protein